MRRYTREDVERSYHGRGSSGLPMVNVKVRADMRDGWRDFRHAEPDADARFTEEWLEEHCPDEDGGYFWAACEDGWELLASDAEEVFGKGVGVYAEGRSGGWCVVTGLPDVDGWNAVVLAKWRKFERWAKANAADIPYRIIDRCYFNDFQAWAEEESELAAPEIPEGLVLR